MDKTATKTIWAVQWDWTSDGLEHDSGFELYASYEGARKEFEKRVNEDKTLNYANYSADDPDDDAWEETKDYWCIWEAGCYCENHSEVRIVKKAIREF